MSAYLHVETLSQKTNSTSASQCKLSSSYLKEVLNHTWSLKTPSRTTPFSKYILDFISIQEMLSKHKNNIQEKHKIKRTFSTPNGYQHLWMLGLFLSVHNLLYKGPINTVYFLPWKKLLYWLAEGFVKMYRILWEIRPSHVFSPWAHPHHYLIGGTIHLRISHPPEI